jgi:pantothenate kinase
VILDSTEALLARAEKLAAAGGRRILGITGAPGAGKSTVAETIAAHLGEAARLVPMDGFHLCQAELVRLGRRDRMGAPDTFDAAGYAALLRRLRDPTEAVVYAPEFRREIEEPIAGAIAVPHDVPLVITEGNYLLLWAQVRPLLDEAWYVETDEALRIERLIARHIEFGKSAEFAREWVLGSDQRNAQLIAPTREKADAVVRLRPRAAPSGTPAGPCPHASG